MSRANSVTSQQGFYVFQPSVGAPLEFQPALGTQELDELIHGYLPGSSSIRDKRAAISMDFFESVMVTGQTAKFYPIPTYSPILSASTSSSPSSFRDSGYGSSYVSPVVPTWSWGHVETFPSVSTPSASSSQSSSSRRVHNSSQESTRPAPRQRSTDFAELPGMKILTRDGRDVTNSASRGCKTKEQRDHAHLMRIMKACDACRRKKIRCDPSHRARVSVKNQTAPLPLPKKQKIIAPEAKVDALDLVDEEALLIGAEIPSFQEFDALFDIEAAPVSGDWFDFNLYERDHTHPPPLDYDFFTDPNGLFSPSPVSGESSVSPVQPVTPISPVCQSSQDNLFVPEVLLESPTLPYLDHSGPPHHYIDFNLYSPASSFTDEELELQIDRKRQPESTMARSSMSSHSAIASSVASDTSWIAQSRLPSERKVIVVDSQAVGTARTTPYLDSSSVIRTPSSVPIRRTNLELASSWLTPKSTRTAAYSPLSVQSHAGLPLATMSAMPSQTSQSTPPCSALRRDISTTKGSSPVQSASPQQRPPSSVVSVAIPSVLVSISPPAALQATTRVQIPHAIGAPSTGGRHSGNLKLVLDSRTVALGANGANTFLQILLGLLVFSTVLITILGAMGLPVRHQSVLKHAVALVSFALFGHTAGDHASANETSVHFAVEEPTSTGKDFADHCLASLNPLLNLVRRMYSHSTEANSRLASRRRLDIATKRGQGNYVAEVGPVLLVGIQTE